jgi:hypothetical protein
MAPRFVYDIPTEQVDVYQKFVLPIQLKIHVESRLRRIFPLLLIRGLWNYFYPPVFEVTLCVHDAVLKDWKKPLFIEIPPQEEHDIQT